MVGMSQDPNRPRSARCVGERLRNARRLRRLSQAQLGKQIGASQSQISTIEKEQSGTSLRTATAAAHALNVSVDYLVGYADDPRPATELKRHLETALARLADVDPDPGVLEDPYIGATDEDFIAVDEVLAAPGTGEDLIDERVVSRRKFGRTWLKTRRLDAHRCRVIRVYGESMAPTIPDGAAMLVDLDTRELRDRGIFVVRLDDDLLVRRLIQHPQGAWLMQSDNPDKRAWPTRPWPGDGRIVGDVRWMSRSFA